jgi:hypothetical protein
MEYTREKHDTTLEARLRWLLAAMGLASELSVGIAKIASCGLTGHFGFRLTRLYSLKAISNH